MEIQPFRKAVEFAEDDPNLGWKDLLEYEIDFNDVVIGIAASGTTPYVIGDLRNVKRKILLLDVLYVILEVLSQMFQIILLK